MDSASSTQTTINDIKLFDLLEQDQISEFLKRVILNVDDSPYILDKIQSKYDVSDRFNAIRHICIDFGEEDKFNSKKFIKFIRSLSGCLQFNILDSVAKIIESTFSIIDQQSTEINQKAQKNSTKPDVLAETQQSSKSQRQNLPKNIILEHKHLDYKEELKKIPKTEENFMKIYEICNRIAAEKDRDAMSFAIKEEYVFVEDSMYIFSSHYNVFTKAAQDNKEDLIQVMLEVGIDINSRDYSKKTALISASKEGHHEIVKLLLTVPGIDVNAKDKWNDTALIRASFKGHYEVVKLLLAVPGIDVNAKNNDNETALYWASYWGHHDIVRLLLSASGIDVNIKGIRNITPLNAASSSRKVEVVKLLLTVPGIDVNAKDDDNQTALMWASYHGNLEIVKLLLSIPGIDVNIKEKDNETALIWASKEGRYEVVKLLLKVPEIDVNAKDGKNKTALIYASEKGHHKISRLLKDYRKI